jgi:hypothetical protein
MSPNWFLRNWTLDPIESGPKECVGNEFCVFVIIQNISSKRTEIESVTNNEFV